jgi:hypothetical protein
LAHSVRVCGGEESHQITVKKPLRRRRPPEIVGLGYVTMMGPKKVQFRCVSTPSATALSVRL